MAAQTLALFAGSAAARVAVMSWRLTTRALTSSAVCLAAVLDRPELVAGKRIGVIISGGNVDLGRLPW